MSRLVDMLFQYTLANRWVKPALAMTEMQAMIANGLWDPADDECREMMRAKMLQQGLKYPKLSVQCRAADAQPGEKVRIKVEVVRCHNYTDDESADLVGRIEREDKAAAAPDADAGDAQAQPGGGEQPTARRPVDEPREGWWVIGEGLRQKGISVGGERVGANEVMHNTLVGRKPLVCALNASAMTCEICFDAPEVPGEYKVMVHVRSSGCVGVDARRKCSFQARLLPPRVALLPPRVTLLPPRVTLLPPRVTLRPPRGRCCAQSARYQVHRLARRRRRRPPMRRW